MVPPAANLARLRVASLPAERWGNMAACDASCRCFRFRVKLSRAVPCGRRLCMPPSKTAGKRTRMARPSVSALAFARFFEASSLATRGVERCASQSSAARVRVLTGSPRPMHPPHAAGASAQSVACLQLGTEGRSCVVCRFARGFWAGKKTFSQASAPTVRPSPGSWRPARNEDPDGLGPGPRGNLAESTSLGGRWSGDGPHLVVEAVPIGSDLHCRRSGRRRHDSSGFSTRAGAPELNFRAAIDIRPEIC